MSVAGQTLVSAKARPNRSGLPTNTYAIKTGFASSLLMGKKVSQITYTYCIIFYNILKAPKISVLAPYLPIEQLKRRAS